MMSRTRRAPSTEGHIDTALVRWPDERDRLRTLRANGTPRLLLVSDSSAPPVISDPLEDWIRVPAAEQDVRARVTVLRARAAARLPLIDDDGRLHHRGRWVALSPVEQRLCAALLQRYGRVLSRHDLQRETWPDEDPDRNRLDVHIGRLRRRLADVDLQLRTVRSRGYVLEADSESYDPGS